MDIRETLSLFFPNWQVIFLALGFIGASTVVSTLLNGQTVANKRLNATKALMIATFATTWGEMLILYSGGVFNAPLAIFLYSGVVMYIAGDTLGYLINRSVMTPGGARGAFWRWVARISQKIAADAGQRALDSLRPTERKVYEKLKQENSPAAAVTEVAVSGSLDLSVIPAGAAAPATSPPVGGADAKP
jgi:hypothetical protein